MQANEVECQMHESYYHTCTVAAKSAIFYVVSAEQLKVRHVLSGTVARLKAAYSASLHISKGMREANPRSGKGGAP